MNKIKRLTSIKGIPIIAPINVIVSITPMINITNDPNIHELLIFSPYNKLSVWLLKSKENLKLLKEHQLQLQSERN